MEMSPQDHAAQRAAVTASLQVDAARLTLHDVYPSRRSGMTPNGAEMVPGASLAAAVANVALGRVPKDSQ